MATSGDKWNKTSLFALGTITGFVVNGAVKELVDDGVTILP